MSIQKKTLYFSAIFLLVFTTILIIVTEIGLWRGMNELEEDAVIKAVERSVIGINNKIEILDASAKDWAQWNDPYDYALGKYPDFIENNISENQFRSLGLNYIVFINNQNEILYKGAFDLNVEEYIEFPEFFLDEVFPLILEKKLISGIVHSGASKPALVAIRPILKTDGSGSPAGMLIFGRQVDDEIIGDISEITSFDFDFFEMSQTENPAFSLNAVKNLDGQNIFIEKDNSEIAYGYTRFFGDLDGNNDLILRVSLPRNIYKTAISISLYLIVGLLFFAILSVFLFLYFIDKLIIKKIIVLSKNIEEFEAGRVRPEKIDVPGNDEISFLATKLKSALVDLVDFNEKSIAKNKEFEKSQKAILNVLEDVEVEKNRSEEAANELQKFKLAVENATEHIIITDPNGGILFANKGVELITGYPIKEVIGKRPSLWGGQMPKEFYEELWNTIKYRKVAFIGEIKNKRKNGEIYIAESHIAPILNPKGEVIFFVGIERDITKTKELDRAKSEFVSVASHQLRTPLTGIKWLTEVLLKNKDNNLTEKQKEILKDINFSNDRVINLVNDLLSISRIEKGKGQDLTLKEVNINSLINEVIKDLKPVASNNGVDLNILAALPKDFKLTIDEEKIRQSMNNLISNAIKYSKPTGGRVDVLAEIKDDELIFSVKDNGIGIPLSAQRRIFEKFFRADNAVLSQTEGTGLGLFIVKTYIENHGGKLWFESKEGEGSTFSFSLKT